MAAPPHPAHPEHPPHGGSDNVVHDDAAAQQKLADAGYTNASLTHRGPNWFGTATNSAGTTVRVMVHGKDGRVSEKTEDEPDPDPA